MSTIYQIAQQINEKLPPDQEWSASFTGDSAKFTVRRLVQIAEEFGLISYQEPTADKEGKKGIRVVIQRKP